MLCEVGQARSASEMKKVFFVLLSFCMAIDSLPIGSEYETNEFEEREEKRGKIAKKNTNHPHKKHFVGEALHYHDYQYPIHGRIRCFLFY